MKFIAISLLLFSSLAVAQSDPNETKGKETDSIGRSIVSKQFSDVLRWAQPMSLRRSSLESDDLQREDELFANSRIRNKPTNKKSRSTKEKSGN